MNNDNFDQVITMKELQNNLEEYIDSGDIIGLLDKTEKKVPIVMIPYYTYEIFLKDLDIFSDEKSDKECKEYMG
jgi:hypothetical protein